ncbi:MAG: GIY-YIG nuclease family protein [Melioribacteraceae bacterium]
MGPTKEQQREKIRMAELAAKQLEKDYQKSLREESIRNFNDNPDFAKIDALSFFGISGIYFLYKNNQLVYIGESRCIISRVSRHYEENTKQFDKFTFSVFTGTSDARKRKEKALIRRFKPKYNNTHNPNIDRRKKVKLIFGASRC